MNLKFKITKVIIKSLYYVYMPTYLGHMTKLTKHIFSTSLFEHTDLL